MLMIAIIIITIFILMHNDEKSKEQKLENEIVGYNTMNGRPILRKYVNITGYDTQTGQPLFEYKKPIIGYNLFTGDPIFEGEEFPKLEETKKTITEEDKNRISNTILIIAGAALIVIASLIFLATGWETMHGLLKTFILLGIQMIFYLFGYISTNKLNIPKIGKMFKYLTLAFVPIVLLSLSFFGLVGDFSINREWDIYFVGFSFIISDIVYKLYGRKNKDLLAKRSSLILETLGIFFITARVQIMNFDIFALILHAFAIYLLIQGGFLDKEAYSEMNLIYLAILIVFSGMRSMYEMDIMSFTNLMLLSLIFFIRCIDTDEDAKRKPSLMLFFIAYLLSIRIIDNVNLYPYFLYLLSLFPILGLIKILQSETMKKNIIKVIGALTISFSIFTYFNPETTIYYVLTYIISFIISTIVFVLSKKTIYKLWSYVSFSAIFFSICYVTGMFNVAKYIMLIIPILVYALEIVYEKLKDNTSTIFIIGSFILETFLLFEEYTMVLPLILMASYILIEKKENLILIPMFQSFMLFWIPNQEVVALIFSILTILYVFLSVTKENFNKYSIFSLITLITLNNYLEVNGYIFWGLLLVWGIIHYLTKSKDKNDVYVTVMIFSLFGLYTKTLTDLNATLYVNYAIGVLLVMLSLTKGVFKDEDKNLLAFLESGTIAGLTLFGTFVIEEPIDGVLYLGALLAVSIIAYAREWKYYLYSSVISIIFGVLVLTAEYWQEIPWYVYILIIGLVLIIFAMYDEKRKQNKLQQDNSISTKELTIETELQQSENPKMKNIESEEHLNISEEVVGIKEEAKEKTVCDKITLQVVENTATKNVLLDTIKLKNKRK